MSICVVGAGAFGTALALSFARSSGTVTLWGRDREHIEVLRQTRENRRYLPGVTLPVTVRPVTEMPGGASIYLFAVPMQTLAEVIEEHLPDRATGALVACCKGLSLASGQAPTSDLSRRAGAPAILTGPSFAQDIARGLPTALTLACEDAERAATLQAQLVSPNLRLYRTSDVTGAELGGALKNVIAIGCGAVMGAGLGVSARAALMTRGFAEISRFAEAQGARRETLAGLSGLGDLTLTCTSDQSRNYRFGQALGAGAPFDTDTTVEGAATARALTNRVAREGIDLPICAAITALLDGEMDVRQAMTALLARPMKEE